MCTEDSDSVIQDEKPTSVCLKGIVKSPTSQERPIPSTHTNMNHKCIKVSVCHVTDLTKIGNWEILEIASSLQEQPIASEQIW